ncbi:MAG: SRPBCC domain-containing protein, partial [Rhizobiaceae bacterium]
MSGELVLTIDRILDAPRASVWRCWTEPALMLKWFTPKPWKTVEVNQDFRPGGASLI